MGNPGAQALQKRQLHLEGVLARVGRRMFADDRGGLHQRRGGILVDRHEPDRRVEPPCAVHGDAFEADKMRRAHDHGDVERPPASNRYACAATGPEYIKPAWGAISATRSPSTSRVA